ncbi:MAG: InlB B-repeat-containing protein [Nitrososphaerota archaeon]|nr:InlB B-repeat-containing protein [Nitrososphaerota archaeon]
MRNQIPKKMILSLMLVLTLVAGCFVTVFTPTANAANPELTHNDVAELEAIPARDAHGNYVHSTVSFANSINDHSDLQMLYWWYDPDNTAYVVYLLFNNVGNSKPVLNAVIDGKSASEIYTAPGEDKANDVVSLVKFTGVTTLTEDSLVTLDTNSGGSSITNKKLGVYFALISLQYYDEVNGVTQLIHSETNPSSTQAPNPITIKYPSDFPVPYEKPGYTFTGWSLIDNPLLRLPDPRYAPDSDVSGNTKLYATWDIDDYVITYVLKGGTNAPNNPPAYTIEDTPITIADASRVGYTFSGWAEGNVIVAGETGDKTFTAHWTAKDDIVVTFDANAPRVGLTVTGPDPASKNVTFDSAYGDLATVNIVGYTFDGWFTAATDGTRVTLATMVSNAANHKLYAHWTAKSGFTLSYDPNTGTGTMANTPATYDDEVTLRTNTFAKTGYNFAGWNTEADGSGAAYTDGQTFVYQVDGNLKLYAQWTAKPYTIKFLLGDDTMGDKLVGEKEFTRNYDDDMPVPPHPYAKFGYKFLGWKGSDGSYIAAPDYKDPTTLKNYPKTVKGSVTYTADWALVNPKQTFPDKIPSETHFDQWWTEYGILCVSSSTTKDGNYEVYFADWFFEAYNSCTIAFGANTKKFDYEIVFTKNSITLWQITGNGAKELKNDKLKYDDNSKCIRDGQHILSKEKNHNYGLDFGMGGTLKGVCFDNPFGSGAKLAWLC